MTANYPPKFTYQDFGSQLTMEFFDPNWFADVVTASGAKYLVFTSKHHDGFANFDSSYTFGWNSVSIGPNRDVVKVTWKIRTKKRARFQLLASIKDLKNAFQAKDPQFHFGIYYSLFEWLNPLYLKDKANKFQTREYVLNKMLPEMKQLAELGKNLNLNLLFSILQRRTPASPRRAGGRF